MKVIKTPLVDCYIIEPTILEDERGYFFESFNKDKFYDLTGVDLQVKQENQSRSNKNVLRGMHFQVGDLAQSKIVRALEGEVLDMVVDLRKSSPTYGQSFKQVLSVENKKQLYVPKGFAHGFLTLSKYAEFFYCMDKPYSPDYERGIMYNDVTLGLNWGNIENIKLSDRDKGWPSYQSNKPYFD